MKKDLYGENELEIDLKNIPINIGISYNLILDENDISRLRATYILKLNRCEIDFTNYNITGILMVSLPGGMNISRDRLTRNKATYERRENSTEYGKKVFSYLESKIEEKVSLFEMLDHGLILLWSMDNDEVTKMYNQRLIDFSNSPVLMKNIRYYIAPDHQFPNLYPIPVISPPQWVERRGLDSNSHMYKLHISVKKEYLGEALKSLFGYPKFFDYISNFKFVRPDFRHSEYRDLNGILNELNDGINLLKSLEVRNMSMAVANIVIYPFKGPDIEEFVLDFLSYWNRIETEHPEWKRNHNYLLFNIRLSDTVYFAYGSDTNTRISCMEGKLGACEPYTEPPIITKLKRDYCKPENRGKVLPCLSDVFNINNYEELCDHSGPRSLSGTYGIIDGKDFPALYDRIKGTECYKDWVEDYTDDIQNSRMEGYSSGLYGGGKRRKKKSKRRSKRKSKKRSKKSRRSKRSSKRR
jgi:hypothetical protein